MKITKILSFIAAFAVFTSSAQDDTKAPKYSNEFLSVGVGARALGMSNSFVASTNDVTSGYWNPAGLTNIKDDMQVSLMHAEYFAGIAKYDYGAFAKPIDSSSTIGFSMIRFGVDNILNTTELIDNQGRIDYNNISTFSAADYAFIFSYARKLKVPGLSVGANAKVVYRKVGEFANSWGFGLDVGAQYKKDNLTLAAMGRDITSTFNAWNYSLSQNVVDVFLANDNEIPENGLEVTLPKLLLGGAYYFQLGDKFSLQPELDLDVTFDGKRNVLIKSDVLSVDPHMGAEFGFKNIVFLRAGFNNLQKVLNPDLRESYTLSPNFGVGIKIKRITLDYALTNISQSVGLYSNIFSLRFDLSKKI